MVNIGYIILCRIIYCIKLPVIVYVINSWAILQFALIRAYVSKLKKSKHGHLH